MTLQDRDVDLSSCWNTATTLSKKIISNEWCKGLFFPSLHWLLGSDGYAFLSIHGRSTGKLLVKPEKFSTHSRPAPAASLQNGKKINVSSGKSKVQNICDTHCVQTPSWRRWIGQTIFFFNLTCKIYDNVICILPSSTIYTASYDVVFQCHLFSSIWPSNEPLKNSARSWCKRRPPPSTHHTRSAAAAPNWGRTVRAPPRPLPLLPASGKNIVQARLYLRVANYLNTS